MESLADLPPVVMRGGRVREQPEPPTIGAGGDGKAQLQKRPPGAPLIAVHAIRNGRRKMEDRHIVYHDLNEIVAKEGVQLDKQWSYYAVFDGHAGADAASYSADNLHNLIVTSEWFKDDVAGACRQAFHEIDRRYLERSIMHGTKSGTTALCLLVERSDLAVEGGAPPSPKKLYRKAYLAWCGDSQAILVRNGVVFDATPPHKPDLESERQRIEEEGGSVVRMDTWRVNGTLAVSRAIGDPDYKPFVSSTPDVQEITFDGSEDFAVLACDGLWDNLTPEEATTTVYETLNHEYNNRASDCDLEKWPETAAEACAQALVKKSVDDGSSDNITAIVVFFKSIDELIATPFKAPSPRERPLIENNGNFAFDFNNHHPSDFNGNSAPVNGSNGHHNHHDDIMDSATAPPLETAIDGMPRNRSWADHYEQFQANTQARLSGAFHDDEVETSRDSSPIKTDNLLSSPPSAPITNALDMDADRDRAMASDSSDEDSDSNSVVIHDVKSDEISATSTSPSAADDHRDDVQEKIDDSSKNSFNLTGNTEFATPMKSSDTSSTTMYFDISSIVDSNNTHSNHVNEQITAESTEPMIDTEKLNREYEALIAGTITTTTTEKSSELTTTAANFEAKYEEISTTTTTIFQPSTESTSTPYEQKSPFNDFFASQAEISPVFAPASKVEQDNLLTESAPNKTNEFDDLFATSSPVAVTNEPDKAEEKAPTANQEDLVDLLAPTQSAPDTKENEALSDSPCPAPIRELDNLLANCELNDPIVSTSPAPLVPTSPPPVVPDEPTVHVDNADDLLAPTVSAPSTNNEFDDLLAPSAPAPTTKELDLNADSSDDRGNIFFDSSYDANNSNTVILNTEENAPSPMTSRDRSASEKTNSLFNELIEAQSASPVAPLVVSPIPPPPISQTTKPIVTEVVKKQPAATVASSSAAPTKAISSSSKVADSKKPSATVAPRRKVAATSTASGAATKSDVNGARPKTATTTATAPKSKATTVPRTTTATTRALTSSTATRAPLTKPATTTKAAPSTKPTVASTRAAPTRTTSSTRTGTTSTTSTARPLAATKSTSVSNTGSRLTATTSRPATSSTSRLLATKATSTTTAPKPTVPRTASATTTSRLATARTGTTSVANVAATSKPGAATSTAASRVAAARAAAMKPTAKPNATTKPSTVGAVRKVTSTSTLKTNSTTAATKTVNGGKLVSKTTTLSSSTATSSTTTTTTNSSLPNDA